MFHNNHLYTLAFSPSADITKDIPKIKSQTRHKAIKKSNRATAKSSKLKGSHMSGQVTEEDTNQDAKFIHDICVGNCHCY